MKVPKYIYDKIRKRALYGELVNCLDVEIHEWMRKKGIETNYSFLEHDGHFELMIQNSIMLLTEPVNLMHITLEYIQQAKEQVDE